MSRVAVNERILRWAMDRSAQTEDDLRRKLPHIHEWVAGERKPTVRQLESFARATRTPLGYLFLREPPDESLPIPHFRTVDEATPTRPSPDLLHTVQEMQRRQAWMREYLIEQGEGPLRSVGSARPEEDHVSIARRIRQFLGFEEGWAGAHSTWTEALRSLREAIDHSGILVVVNGVVGNNTHRKLDPSEFRGFVLVDEYVPLVFVNGADGKAAQMFTLAHELAHVFLGSSAAFDLRELQPANDPVEEACNQIAAEFLVPQTELRQFWQSAQYDSDPFQAVARFFKVSHLVAARRALDLSLIGREEFFEFYRLYQANQQRDDERRGDGGGNFYNNQNLRVGRRFASAVVRAVKEGRLLYTEAYELTGLSGDTFQRYGNSLQAGGS